MMLGLTLACSRMPSARRLSEVYPTPTPAPITFHVDSDPFLFAYPGPDCDLPDALTNIDGDDCTAITVWGIEGSIWMSYDAASSAGALGPYGLDADQAYIITHTGCVCTDWEMCP